MGSFTIQTRRKSIAPTRAVITTNYFKGFRKALKWDIQRGFKLEADLYYNQLMLRLRDSPQLIVSGQYMPASVKKCPCCNMGEFTYWGVTGRTVLISECCNVEIKV